MNEVDKLRQELAEKDRRIAELEMLLKAALERITELERRLALNSGNSSKPPSSDGLKKPPRVRSLRDKGKKPSGGQFGHTGETLTQTDDPNRIIDHCVSACEMCHADLKSKPVERVIRRQVFDLPEPEVLVDEHRAEVKICSCGHRNVAKFPSGVNAPVQYGPRVKATAVYLSNQQLVPEDRLQEYFEDVHDLPISTATLASINEKFAEIAKPKQEAVLETLKVAEVKHQDETGLRIGGKTQWLHVISNDQYTHYRVSPKRGDLLEGVTGITVHDHWKPYFTMQNVLHGLCNSHHLRELKALDEIEEEPWSRKMIDKLREFSKVEAPLQGEQLAQAFIEYDVIVREGIAYHENLPPLTNAKPKRGRQKKRIGHNLLERLRLCKEAVLRFLTNAAVPFTNNQAERDVRMMKVRQKISGGFRTTKGAEQFCVTRGFLSTQRKQRNNLFLAIQGAIVEANA